MAEYTMDDVFEDVVLDIGGKRFRLRERTQGLSKRIEKLQAETEKLADDAPDDEAMVPALDLLDLLLEPLGDGNNGSTRTHVKTILSRAYKNDEIGADRVFALLNFCQDKMLGRMDPTSRLTSDD